LSQQPLQKLLNRSQVVWQACVVELHAWPAGQSVYELQPHTPPMVQKFEAQSLA
jgi:hypothetical protein